MNLYQILRCRVRYEKELNKRKIIITIQSQVSYNMMKAFITGSGFYDFPSLNQKTVRTNFGTAEVLRGKPEGVDEEILLLPRHGKNHYFLSSQINHLANISALKKEGATSIISLSVAGALLPEIKLATPLIPDDIFFPENRLPDGSVCSVFQNPGEERGHLIAGSLLNSDVQNDISTLFPKADNGGTYVHSFGPRFNTKSEIKMFQSIGGAIISQTCGPEAVLANELEIPYGLFVFPVDYANGVMQTPTSPQELNKNLKKSKEVFTQLILGFSSNGKKYEFQNFVYRF